MKRIVFVNLHANAFLVKTLNKFLFKRSAAVKHRYFLDYLLSRSDIQVCSYINDSGFSLLQNNHSLNRLLYNLLAHWEHRFIIRKNNLPLKAIKVLRKTEISTDDIIISYVSDSGSLRQISDLRSFKAASALHYLGKQSMVLSTKSACIDYIFDESNLKEYSEIFKRQFTWYHNPVLVHPFVFATRFKRIKPFSERENRAFSTGTIIDIEGEEFFEVYKDKCNQPARRQIYDNADHLKPWIACYNSYFLEDDNVKDVKSTDNRFVKTYKVLYNMSHSGQQKKYFSFDMVERFNHFKMFIVGEEIVGIPGIGFVEGMACGCAYIGQTIGYYEDYGMQAGIHYIGYDGSLDDLKAKITYYQQPEHQAELERIANAGYEFAQTHFRGDAVAKELLDKLIQAQQEWKASR